ncbi:Mechanosensitive ion channel family protein [Ophiocordyceps sinensis CO18]|uniref:Mechanosensitive ion channel family protein n=1 Tax=Ophiocordyceps sinensis (strain Co18 / CGMCC 3.14243) TaxID=911162 RepID=T5AJR9_OPHSC|nr:Mechanosensitive ion channel family protein [Ophiocordyceps sinensis CO18]
MDNYCNGKDKKNEDAALYRFWLFYKKSPSFVRYIVYLIPGAAMLLLPVLLGAFRFSPDEMLVGGTGGVELLWFGIWLEIVWCSLWLSRLVTSLMPHLFYSLARVACSTNAKKWKYFGQQLELHTALFLWILAMLVAFKRTNYGHRAPVPNGWEDEVNLGWIDIVNKVIIALFTMASLNFVEKIGIQLIATSFHSTRIVNNKADIGQLVQLYKYAKARLEQSNNFWQISNILGAIDTNVPRQVVSELLRSTPAAHALARLICKSVVRDGRDTVYPDDLKSVFETQEEVDAAFGVFDKSLNGDISVEEFEAVCNEIHLEKKAIAASLKDLDSVIGKLDKVFLVIIVVITAIVFVSILSGLAAAGLVLAGAPLLGFAWVVQPTAEEFLQCVKFFFLKHPFDVGDRVTIYGIPGGDMAGNDYYVANISLHYTEFKDMHGYIVRESNPLLNTLAILNRRRSGSFTDVLSLEMRFGTPACVIDELKDRMVDYCLNNKRDFQPTIIMEMTKLDQVRSCHMNMAVLHKSHFQDELLRLNRHNKFVTEVMHQMTQLGIQTP